MKHMGKIVCGVAGVALGAGVGYFIARQRCPVPRFADDRLSRVLAAQLPSSASPNWTQYASLPAATRRAVAVAVFNDAGFPSYSMGMIRAVEAQLDAYVQRTAQIGSPQQPQGQPQGQPQRTA